MVDRSGHEELQAPPEVEIDREACMGSGNCMFWAPDVFDLDDDGVAVVHGDIAGTRGAGATGGHELPHVGHPYRRGAARIGLNHPSSGSKELRGYDQ
jgi:ferredoxin